MAIQVAESTSRPKSTPKVLAHLEIHPQLGGGHIIKHVYSSYDHRPREVKFNEKGVAKGGETIAAHLAKHAGIPGLAGEHEAGDSEKEADEE